MNNMSVLRFFLKPHSVSGRMSSVMCVVMQNSIIFASTEDTHTHPATCASRRFMNDELGSPWGLRRGVCGGRVHDISGTVLWTWMKVGVVGQPIGVKTMLNPLLLNCLISSRLPPLTLSVNLLKVYSCEVLV